MSGPCTEYTQNLHGESATVEFGKRLARATFRDPQQSMPGPGSPGCPTIGGVIHIEGDLGAGKTTLTRGVMRGYGYEGAVKSPTYTLVEPYNFTDCNIYHFDLYRLSDPEEVTYLGIEDYFSDDNLCLVEWAERGRNTIPPADLVITLSGTGTERDLRCQTRTEKGNCIAKRLWV